jgi:hypothetical protein
LPGPRAVCVDAGSAVVWELLGCFIQFRMILEDSSVKAGPFMCRAPGLIWWSNIRQKLELNMI